jgi:hypothetical protein
LSTEVLRTPRVVDVTGAAATTPFARTLAFPRLWRQQFPCVNIESGQAICGRRRITKFTLAEALSGRWFSAGIPIQRLRNRSCLRVWIDSTQNHRDPVIFESASMILDHNLWLRISNEARRAIRACQLRRSFVAPIRSWPSGVFQCAPLRIVASENRNDLGLI